MFISLQHQSAANLTLDTSTPKCIMLHRTKLVTALQRDFGTESFPLLNPLWRQWNEKNIH